MNTRELEQLVEQAPIAMCVVTSPSFRVKVVNRLFRDLASATLAKPGMRLNKARTGTLAARLVPLCQRVLETSEAFNKDRVRIGKRQFEVTGVPLWRTDEVLWAIALTIVEVTEVDQRKAKERQVRRLAVAALTREARIAARFQSSVLPRGQVHVPGCVVAHTYRPGLAEADVGGDFYNIFSLGEGRGTCIVLGDVGGKGLEAAIVAARVQHSIVALALNNDAPPGLVLKGVHRVCAAMEKIEQIVTVFLGFIEPDTGLLQYANAGQDPPFVWRSQRSCVESLGYGEMAIVGLEPDFDYATHSITLEPEDLLLMYTDGLPEAQAKEGKELFGPERIQSVLTSSHKSDPAAIIERLYHSALSFSQGHLRDDIAMIVLRKLWPNEETKESTFVGPPKRS